MSGGTVTQVLGAVQQGAVSVDEVVRSTGIPRDRVSLAIDTLGRMGLVDAGPASGCPTSGCVTCVSACQLNQK